MEPDQTPIEIAPIPPYTYPAPLVEPEQPKERSKPVQVPPYQRPPTRPGAYVPEPVARVPPKGAQAAEHPIVTMSHPETVTLPPVQEVERYQKPVAEDPKVEVQRKPPTTSTSGSKPEEKSSIQKKKPPKSEEKASEPGSKNKKGRKFNGGGGRIHTEAHIDRILDEFILTGNLPSYVSERQRYDYRHHIRLPERRQLLGKQQAGNKASGTSTTTGTKGNITHFPGTGTHDS